MRTWKTDAPTRPRGAGILRPALVAVCVLVPFLVPALAAEPQFDIQGFTLRITNAEGVVTHVLRGERMQQFDEIGVQHAEKPRLELMTEGRLDWIWTAPAAVHYPADQRLVLIGRTEGLQLPGPQNPRTDIESEDVTVLTGTREVLTDARATLTRPGLVMTGIGMHADATTEIIELRSEVNTVYSPDETQEQPQ